MVRGANKISLLAKFRGPFANCFKVWSCLSVSHFSVWIVVGARWDLVDGWAHTQLCYLKATQSTCSNHKSEAFSLRSLQETSWGQDERQYRALKEPDCDSWAPAISCQQRPHLRLSFLILKKERFLPKWKQGCAVEGRETVLLCLNRLSNIS